MKGPWLLKSFAKTIVQLSFIVQISQFQQVLLEAVIVQIRWAPSLEIRNENSGYIAEVIMALQEKSFTEIIVQLLTIVKVK